MILAASKWCGKVETPAGGLDLPPPPRPTPAKELAEREKRTRETLRAHGL
jgi:hypothetical protein